MSDIVDEFIKLNIDEIKDFKFPLDELFGLEISHEGVKYNFMINFKSTSSKLICAGSGAHTGRAKGDLITPLFFSRWSWHKYFDQSFIVYTDPIFYLNDDVRIGWYIGDEDHWYLKTISDIILKLMENQDIKNEDVLFYGSSGGGFASLGLGTLIRESRVIVNNAQFFVLNYHQEHVDMAMNTLFEGRDIQEVYDKFPYRLDIVELFKKENYMPQIDYYVNADSNADLNNHAVPFINKASQLDCFNENLNIHFYHSNSGHDPLGNKETISIIKSYFINESPDGIKESEEKLKKENKKLKAKNKKLEKEIEHFKSTKAYKTWQKYAKLRKK